MRKINYTLDENNVIIHWIAVPFDINKPFIEIEDSEEIHLGFDKIINGELVKDTEGYLISKATQDALYAKHRRIMELKQLLDNSDYMCLKYVDGALTEEEYSSVRAQRAAWRAEINELEEN